MKKIALLLCSLMVAASSAETPKCSAFDHAQWIGGAFREMDAIRVGMKREDLLRVFTPQAGFASGARFRGSYVYRDSPYIKVDVEFSRAEGTTDDSGPDRPDDVIKSISQPYLASPVFD